MARRDSSERLFLYDDYSCSSRPPTEINNAAAAAAEEIIQTLKMKPTTQKDESVLIPQGLACSWSCMPEGCAMRMTERLPKRLAGAASPTF